MTSVGDENAIPNSYRHQTQTGTSVTADEEPWRPTPDEARPEAKSATPKPSSPTTEKASLDERQRSEIITEEHTEDSRLEERKLAICEAMRMRLDSRRKDWDAEVDRMRRNFFQPKSSDESSSSDEWNQTTTEAKGQTLHHQGPNRSTVCEDGNKFRVSFDVRSFQPSEICVRTENRKLVVCARHDEKSRDGKRTVTRQFNRQIDIPRNVQPEAIRCTLSRDGTLKMEADILPQTPRTPGSPSSQSPTSASAPFGFPPLRSYNPNASPKKFTVSIDIGKDFCPEDLEVKTVDRKLVVEARQHDLRPGRTRSKEFHREFDLPDTIDPVTVTANMTEEGLLLIEAPFRQ